MGQGNWTKRSVLGKSVVFAVALAIAGVAAGAGLFLMLSNTSKDTGTIQVFNADYSVTTDIPATIPAASPTSLSYGATRNSPGRNYVAESFLNVCFAIVFSNRTASEFDALSVTFAPAGDAYTKANLAVITHPTVPAISGVGIEKCYNAANLGSLPAAGTTATFTGTFTLGQGVAAGTMEFFGWVEGEK